MPQFFVEQELIPGRIIEIRGAEARHIVKSLRLTIGDWLILSDGAGKSFRSRIVETRPTAVSARIEAELPRRAHEIAPTLAIAVISRDRLEWAIEKSVELGCRRIIPFHSQRSEPCTSRMVKHDRWQRIALEAAKQSGLPFRPDIVPPITFPELCKELERFSPALLLYEGEREHALSSALDGFGTSSDDSQHPRLQPLVIIGPEGGFASEEVELAHRHGAMTVSLGTQILRVETAAVTALAILQYELGNLQPL